MAWLFVKSESESKDAVADGAACRTSVFSAPAPEGDVRAEFNSVEETLEAAGRLLNWMFCICNRLIRI